MRSAPDLKCAALARLLVAGVAGLPHGAADDEFPFGLEMTLDAAPQPGSKRLPTLEIGDNGEVRLELWCKGGRGQFSIAGNTVIFVAGPLEDRTCPPDAAQADDALVAALSEADHLEAAGRSRLVLGAPAAALPAQYQLIGQASRRIMSAQSAADCTTPL